MKIYINKDELGANGSSKLLAGKKPTKSKRRCINYNEDYAATKLHSRQTKTNVVHKLQSMPEPNSSTISSKYRTPSVGPAAEQIEAR